MHANNIKKQQKLVVREEKILKRKQNKPFTILEIMRMRIMYAPVSRIFNEWSRCSKLWNEWSWRARSSAAYFDVGGLVHSLR
jgi:hypothetical protein